MSSDQVAVLTAAVVALLYAATAYIYARQEALKVSVASHEVQLNGPTAARDARISALEIAGGGRVPPAWDQLRDPMSNGVLPVQRFQECGEEVAAMIVDWKHGVPLSADALRAMLARPDGGALTSGADIVRLLSLCNVRSVSTSPLAVDAQKRIRSETGAGRPVAVLVREMSAGGYHWLCAYSSDDAVCHYVDPWGGVRVSQPWTALMARYAGTIVAVVDTPDSVLNP